MAISWPIFQAQLRGLTPAPQMQIGGMPADQSGLLFKGISGIGQNFIDASDRAKKEEQFRIKAALEERELAAREAYQKGMLGVQQGELGIKQQTAGRMADFAKALQGLGGMYDTAPAGGPGRSSAAPGLPSFVTSGGAMSNLDTGTRIYNKLVERNVDPKVAAGIVGNMGVESRFSSSALNPNDKGQPSFGLVQHRGDRAARLHANAAKAGKHWSDEDTQVDTVVEELFGSENDAYKAALAAGSPAEAAAILAEKYERPSKSALRQTLPERMAVAEAIGATSRAPAEAPPAAGAPPPAAPQRVASLDPTAGLVPPPMAGTPAPPPAPPIGPPPPLPPPAPPQRQQEQLMPGQPLFATAPPPGPPPGLPPAGPGPGPTMTLPGAPGAIPGPPPPGPPPPQQTAQAVPPAGPGGLGAGAAALRRKDPRLLQALAAAAATGDPTAMAAYNAAVSLIAPEPRYSVSDGFRVEGAEGTIEPVPGMRRPGMPGGGDFLLPPGDPRRPSHDIDPKDPRTYKIGVDAQGNKTIDVVPKADEREDKTPERLLQYSQAWEGNETVKDYRKMENAVSGLKATLDQGNGISDMAAVIQLFKSIDPASTVSATETANAQTASGVDNRLWGFFNQLQGGGSLTDASRARLFNVARQILEERRPQAEQLTQGAMNRARAAGLDPTHVTGGWAPRQFERATKEMFPDREIDGTPRAKDAPKRPGETKANAIDVDSAEAAAGVDGWWRYRDPKSGKTVEGFNP